MVVRAAPSDAARKLVATIEASAAREAEAANIKQQLAAAAAGGAVGEEEDDADEVMLEMN